MKHFKNSHPHSPHGFLDVLRWKLGRVTQDSHLPDCDGLPDSLQRQKIDFQNIPDSTIQTTWIGHASFLIQCGGTNILIDPVYASHCSPIPLPSLKRLQPPGIDWQHLPTIHYVLITHNHYDHLDLSVVKKLAKSAHFIVPSGLLPWLKKHSVPTATELPWHRSLSLGNLTITSLPAQHSSSRTPWDTNASHWCGWLIEYRGKKIFHAGDTGYCPHFQEIGSSYGPIDLSLLPIGAYSPRAIMQPVHCDVAEAVQIHLDICSALSIGCHWGTFPLTAEPTLEPPSLLAAEMTRRGLKKTSFTTLPIGGSVKLNT